MEEDLQLYGLTQETYLYRAKKIIEYFKKPPEEITDDELREPHYIYSSKLFTLIDKNEVLAFTSPLIFANLHYLLR